MDPSIQSDIRPSKYHIQRRVIEDFLKSTFFTHARNRTYIHTWGRTPQPRAVSATVNRELFADVNNLQKHVHIDFTLNLIQSFIHMENKNKNQKEKIISYGCGKCTCKEKDVYTVYIWYMYI